MLKSQERLKVGALVWRSAQRSRLRKGRELHKCHQSLMLGSDDPFPQSHITVQLQPPRPNLQCGLRHLSMIHGIIYEK